MTSFEVTQQKANITAKVKRMFGAFPLKYVIAHERDAIGERTARRGDEGLSSHFVSSRLHRTVDNRFFGYTRFVRLVKLYREPRGVASRSRPEMRYEYQNSHMYQIMARIKVPWKWRILRNALLLLFCPVKLGLLVTFYCLRNLTQEKA